MIIIKNIVFGLSITLLTTTSFTQEAEFNKHVNFEMNLNDSDLMSTEKRSNVKREFHFDELNDERLFEDGLNENDHVQHKKLNLFSKYKIDELSGLSSFKLKQSKLNLGFSSQEKEPFFKNRRNVYSSMWAFASLNYLYADLVGLMDANVLAQYQKGVVDGTKITPSF